MTKKIKYILLFSFLIILGLCTKSQARITTSDPTVSSGGTATITINSQESVGSGMIDVSSNGGLTFVSASSSYGVANGTRVAFSAATGATGGIATYTFRVPTVSTTTTYQVTFSASEMATAEGEPVSDSQATATVTVRGTSTGNSSSGSNNNSGGSSSGGSNSNSGGGSSNETNNTSSTTPTFRNVDDTVYATSNGINVRSSYSTSSRSIGTLNEGDELTRTGIATSAVNGITWSRVTYNGQTAYVSSSYLTTEKPEESNNKALASLSVEDGLSLTPEFSSDVTEYSLTVGSDINSIDISAVAEDDNAEVEITGNDNLLMGENTIEIRVTAEDGTVRTYTINVTKGETSTEAVNGIGLSELTIEGYTLSPNFSSDVYEYTLNIADPSVTSLNINANSDIEDATIEIVGNDALVLGENIITILVKAEGEDGIVETITYQIIVNITEKKQIIAGIDDDDLFLYGGIALAVLIVLIIIIIAIVMRRNKNKGENGEATYYNGFSSLNNDNFNSDESENTEFNKEEKLDNKTEVTDSVFDEVKVGKLSNQNSILDETEKTRKTVIEENFGADIKTDNFDDDSPRRKRGKHF